MVTQKLKKDTKQFNIKIIFHQLKKTRYGWNNRFCKKIQNFKQILNWKVFQRGKIKEREAMGKLKQRT